MGKTMKKTAGFWCGKGKSPVGTREEAMKKSEDRNPKSERIPKAELQAKRFNCEPRRRFE